MRRFLAPSLVIVAILAIWTVKLPANDAVALPNDLQTLAKDAVSADRPTAVTAIKLLRQRGPAGLEALFARHAALIAHHTAPTESATARLEPLATPTASAPKDDPAWQRLRTALDDVGAQRDCYASRLFWYTDLEAAKAVAQREHKPILSLRLLGNLTDEFSCANSRFFRATLYSNPEISRVLRERFVLHWKSVRPAPKITIDFGDGRKLERTVTGNSIHYILDADGQLIDALPGLYGAKPFGRELERAEQAASQKMKAADQQKFLADYHRDRTAAILAAWEADLKRLKIAPDTSKPNANTLAASLFRSTDESTWNRLAQLHDSDCALDPVSVAMIDHQHPTAAEAAPSAFSKWVVEKPLVRLIRNLQGSIALDTVRNEYLFHRQIHEWLAAGPTPDLDSFNEQVYAQLFLTPSSDPWLGLMPPGVYTGLEDNGVTETLKLERLKR